MPQISEQEVTQLVKLIIDDLYKSDNPLTITNFIQNYVELSKTQSASELPREKN